MNNYFYNPHSRYLFFQNLKRFTYGKIAGLTLLLAFCSSFAAFAQTTPQFLIGGGTGTNSFPFNTTATKKTQLLYLPGDLPGAAPGNITRIYFRASTTVASSTFSDFKIRLGQSTATVFPGAGSLDFFTGLTTVLSAPSYTIPSPVVDAWFSIDLPTPFLYNPAQTLIVEVEMANKISGGITVRTMNTSAAPNHKRLTASSVGATTGSASAIWHDFGIDVVPAGPCTAPANPGTISGNLNTCPGITNNLQLNGYTLGASLQWQSSPDGINWTDITGATTAFYTTPPLTTSTYYRVNVTCGTTAASPAVQLIVGSGAITSYPHLQNFDNVAAPNLACGWTKLNANNDASTWNTIASNSYSSPNSVIYNYNSAAAANDWLFSPQLTFNNQNNYRVTFRYKGSSATYSNDLEVRWGTAATPAGMPASNTIFSDQLVRNTAYTDGITSVIAPPATGTYYVGFYLQTPSGVFSNVHIDDVLIEEIPGCTGTPTAGVAPVGPIGYCANTPVILAVTGATNSPRTEYQWEQATSAAGPWSNAVGGSGATTLSYTVPNNLTSGIFYRLKVTCLNSSLSATTTPVEITINPARFCYCFVNLHGANCTPFDNIDSVSIVGTTLANGNTGCTNANGPAYTKYAGSGSLTGTLQVGTTYRFNVMTAGNSVISVWIDFNQNGQFESQEWYQITSSSTGGQVSFAQITIPNTARNGQTGMRVRSRGVGNPNGSTDACTPFGGGETEDYLVTITGSLVGVAEELAKAINVYPNPNNGTFKIEAGDAGNKAIKVQLINTLGQVVFTDETKGAYSKEVDVTGVAAGIYILQVNADGVTASKRISIEK